MIKLIIITIIVAMIMSNSHHEVNQKIRGERTYGNN